MFPSNFTHCLNSVSWNHTVTPQFLFLIIVFKIFENSYHDLADYISGMIYLVFQVVNSCTVVVIRALEDLAVVEWRK